MACVLRVYGGPSFATTEDWRWSVSSSPGGATGGEIAKRTPARHLDGNGKNQVRHAGRSLHQWIVYAVLEEIRHALGARRLMGESGPANARSRAGPSPDPTRRCRHTCCAPRTRAED